ncbi:MAG: glutaredoxin family protein [Xanthomonadales bacterium]|nr:glutaredoxin family protein [Xanthomonadales bacterium]
MPQSVRPEPAAPLRLLQRPVCLLCLEAEWVLAQAGIDQFQRVDIERDPALEERYGIRIPLLIDAAGRELDWPFDPAAVEDWLAAAQ